MVANGRTGPHRAPTLVFLPGSLCDERLFTHQLDELGRSFPTEVVDFSGLTTIEDMATRALDLVAGPMIPIGLSMGGIVAAELLGRAPEQMAAAVLLDTNLALPAAGQVATRRRWANQTRAGQYRDVVQEMIPQLTADVGAGAGLAAAMALDAGSLRFLDENEALINRRRDRRPDLDHFQRPVLLIVGEHDQVCAPSLHREMATSAVDGRLVVVPASGHLSTIDEPEFVTRTIAQWLPSSLSMTTYAEPLTEPVDSDV